MSIDDKFITYLDYKYCLYKGGSPVAGSVVKGTVHSACFVLCYLL